MLWITSNISGVDSTISEVNPNTFVVKSTFHKQQLAERELREPKRVENLHGEICGPGTSFGSDRGARKLTGRLKLWFLTLGRGPGGRRNGRSPLESARRCFSNVAGACEICSRRLFYSFSFTSTAHSAARGSFSFKTLTHPRVCFRFWRGAPILSCQLSSSLVVLFVRPFCARIRMPLCHFLLASSWIC